MDGARPCLVEGLILARLLGALDRFCGDLHAIDRDRIGLRDEKGDPELHIAAVVGFRLVHILGVGKADLLGFELGAH